MTAFAIFEAVALLQRRPVAVQALWDGDSSGWVISVQAVYAYGPSHGIEEVAHLRGSDGDLRIFNQAVPPWPETQIASEAGRLIEKHLEIPFFFPSPVEPESDCPDWWDRHLGKKCRTCSKLLLQEETLPWFGVCYFCHLKQRGADPKEAD
ncbi:hypothetical protein [Prosthecobacter fluviatilis]|uniref:Uncharacterized protein n=1 Tax=Prosthecobacter fluviatilis TaxID=445931 RepID=A0ABW0KQG1_9BACT